MKTINKISMPTLALALLLTFGLAATASAATLYRSLDLGMTGDDVSSLQTFLSSDGNIYPSKLVTGYFGQLTKAGVERFQADEGIVSAGTPATTGYGRVGPRTMAAINAKMTGGVYTGGDNVAPTIFSLGITTSSNSATFSWDTTENSAGVIYYSASPISMIEANASQGVVISGSSVLANSDLRSAHSATISGLSPNTTYNYVVYVRDGSGNETVTVPATFVTTN